MVAKFVTLFLFIGHFFKQLINLIHFFHDLKFSLHAMTDNSPFLVVAVDDLKARSSSWCIDDKSNYE